MHLAVTIDTAASDPELLDQPRQAPVLDTASRMRMTPPSVVVATMHLQQTTQQPNRQHGTMLVAKGVSHSW